jgi:hypothetical protein
MMFRLAILRATDPEPHQFHEGRCIRCGVLKVSAEWWTCPVRLYGPGDIIKKVMRFMGFRLCSECRARQMKLNLWWFGLRGVIHASIF